MALIKWKDTYSVGVEHLDNQHKELVALINGLHDAMRIGKGKETLNEITNNLITYTSTHFKSEEELFAQHNYPDSKKHMEEHSKFVEDVLSFKKNYDEGNLMLTIEVMDFLKNWLIKHILGSDMEYKLFFNSNGVN